MSADADLLRKAAALLHAAYDDVAAHSDGWAQSWPIITLAQHCNPEVVHFVRTMSPAVALAGADLLEEAADREDFFNADSPVPPERRISTIDHELAIARAILGEVTDA